MTLCNRGDIWRIDFTNERAGHEIDKIRPALVVSNDSLNQKMMWMVTVVPITDAFNKLKDDGTPKFTTQVLITPDSLTGLSKLSVAVCDQIRSVDRIRMKGKLGTLDSDTLERIDEAIIWALAL